MTWNPKQPRVAAGSAGGGRWGSAGPARNAQAAKAQQNPKAQKQYTEILSAKPDQRADYAKGLSTDDLKALTQILYSSRTSDPDVVHARLAVAAEMGKRGLDIKQYGALGGGLPPAKTAALKKVAAQQVAKKAAPKRLAAPATPAPSSLRAPGSKAI